MGAGYGILQGLTQGLTGIQQGEAKRRELQQQAMRQMLQDSLMKAQIQDTQAQTQQRLRPPRQPKSYTSHFDPETGLLITVDTETGEHKVEQVAKPKAPKAQAPVLGSPEYLKAETDLAKMRAANRPPRTPKDPPAVIQQRRGSLSRAKQLHKQMTDLETKYAKQGIAIGNPPVTSTIAGGLKNVPVVGKLVGGGADRLAQAQLSKDQAEYKRLKQEFGASYVQSQPAGTRAIAMQSFTQGMFAPPEGTTVDAYPAFSTAREQSLADTEAGLGEGESPPAPPRTSVTPTATARAKSFGDLKKKYGLQ